MERVTITYYGEESDERPVIYMRQPVDEVGVSTYNPTLNYSEIWESQFTFFEWPEEEFMAGAEFETLSGIAGISTSFIADQKIMLYRSGVELKGLKFISEMTASEYSNPLVYVKMSDPVIAHSVIQNCHLAVEGGIFEAYSGVGLEILNSDIILEKLEYGVWLQQTEGCS